MEKSKVLAALAASILLCGCGGGDDSDSGDSAGTDRSDTGGSPQSDSGASNSAPKISGTPLTLIYEEDVYSFEPQAADPDGDTLSFSIENRPSWATFDASTGRLSGTPGAADVGTHRGIRISVSDGELEASLSAFDLRVEAVSHGSFTLSWLPPTENTDDSPLQNLDGFNIYWGTSPGDYPNTITVENEGATSYYLEGLEPGKYYFATTAFNVYGTESALSDYAVIVVR